MAPAFGAPMIFNGSLEMMVAVANEGTREEYQ